MHQKGSSKCLKIRDPKCSKRGPEMSKSKNNIFIPPITTGSSCFLTPNIFRSQRQQRTFPEFSLFHTCCNGKNQPRIPANYDLKPFSISAMVRRRKTLFLIPLCMIFQISTKKTANSNINPFSTLKVPFAYKCVWCPQDSQSIVSRVSSWPEPVIFERSS